MKGSLFDGDMKAVCFILCETSSSERFTAVPESRVQRQSQNGRVQRRQNVSMYRARTAESRDQSPENDLRKIPENRMVCGVGSTNPITTVVMIFR